MADNDGVDRDSPHDRRSATTDDALELMATTRTGVDMSSNDRSGSTRDIFELVAVILLALAAVATAWAGFQAAKWGGVQASNTSQANAARTESVRFSTLAGQQASIDVTTFFNWISAVVDDADSGDIVAPYAGEEYVPAPQTLSGFIFDRMRDEFRPAVQAWLDADPFRNPDAPANPFQMPEYELAAATQAHALQGEAEAKSNTAAHANQTSDNFIVSAVLFAAALFFAALSGKLVKSRYKTIALGIATIVFVGTIIYVFTLPIEV